MFRIGQKVVCVDASPSQYGCCESALEKDAIYTISGLPNRRGVIVAEVKMPSCELFPQGHAGWRIERFRPLVERKADMEARKALFNKWLASEEVTVDG